MVPVPEHFFIFFPFNSLLQDPAIFIWIRRINHSTLFVCRIITGTGITVSTHFRLPVSVPVYFQLFYSFNSLLQDSAIFFRIQRFNYSTLFLHKVITGTSITVSIHFFRQMLGILMYMSVVQLPALKLHWNVSMRNQVVAKAMTRDRFHEIVSALHISDNDRQPARDDPNYDRIFKVRELLTNLGKHFEEYADFEEVLSVDEAMIPFKGKLGLKRYMMKKPKKWGVKVWCLGGWSGYIYKFSIDGDNLEELTEDELEELEFGIGSSGHTVLSLLHGVPPGTEVFFDNYFASPALLYKLKQLQIPAACTMRAYRTEKCPLKQERELKKEGRGSMDFCRSADPEGVLLVKWYDNKDVIVASNSYSVAPITKVRRYDKTKKKYTFVNCPAVIQAYNKGMGGVDRSDQLVSFYRYR